MLYYRAIFGASQLELMPVPQQVTSDGLRIEIYRGLLAGLRRKFGESMNTEGGQKQRGLDPIPVPQPYLVKFEDMGHRSHLRQLVRGAQVESICRDGTIMQINIKE